MSLAHTRTRKTNPTQDNIYEETYGWRALTGCYGSSFFWNSMHAAGNQLLSDHNYTSEDDTYILLILHRCSIPCSNYISCATDVPGTYYMVSSERGLQAPVPSCGHNTRHLCELLIAISTTGFSHTRAAGHSPSLIWSQTTPPAITARTKNEQSSVLEPDVGVVRFHLPYPASQGQHRNKRHAADPTSNHPPHHL